MNIDCFCSQVEGTCSGKYGFIICVTGMGHVGKGSIREGSGTALFKVHYSCVVLRPFKGEVLDCVVSSVNKVRRFQCHACNLHFSTMQCYACPSTLPIQTNSIRGLRSLAAIKTLHCSFPLCCRWAFLRMLDLCSSLCPTISSQRTLSSMPLANRHS